MRPIGLALALACLSTGSIAVAQSSASADARVRKAMSSPSYRGAAKALESGHDQWVRDVVTITEIPAPPFKERKRAEAFADMLRQRGLVDVEIDEEGNVLGRRPGTGGGDLVMVSAHLDTVFPEGTNIKVRKEANRLYAPGISDDSAGLATLLSLIDALKAGGVKTRSDLLFVGTVGEEGPGDLRGVRHLFTKGPYKDRIKAFFSVE